jgi:hypothetical protein
MDVNLKEPVDLEMHGCRLNAVPVQSQHAMGPHLALHIERQGVSSLLPQPVSYTVSLEGLETCSNNEVRARGSRPARKLRPAINAQTGGPCALSAPLK